MLNLYQQLLVATYERGEYAHITSVDEARSVGDTLFLFLMIELSDDEDCDSLETAQVRVETAHSQLAGVLVALYDAKEKA